MSMYVCPDCQTPLSGLRCSRCTHQYEYSNGFPVLLPNTDYRDSRGVANAYESIYVCHSNVWLDQGRTPEFVEYFSRLLAALPATRLLEIGCGEGALLAAVSAGEKYGTELSTHALKKTLAQTSAQLCIALGERLPFCDEYFDVVVSVGVMEHFLNPDAASREICRVLRRGGHYLVLIHVPLTLWRSLVQKVSEYLYPHPHPVRLTKWIAGKLFRPIRQPIQNRYTLEEAKACLQRSGLEVKKLIDKAREPAAPLVGPHVIIFFCQKPS